MSTPPTVAALETDAASAFETQRQEAGTVFSAPGTADLAGAASVVDSEIVGAAAEGVGSILCGLFEALGSISG